MGFHYMDYGLEMVRSREELRSTFGLDAAATFGFGSFSGSLAVSAYSDERSNFHHLVLVRSLVGSFQKTATGAQLTKAAAGALKRSAEAFHFPVKHVASGSVRTFLGARPSF